MKHRINDDKFYPDEIQGDCPPGFVRGRWNGIPTQVPTNEAIPTIKDRTKWVFGNVIAILILVAVFAALAATLVFRLFEVGLDETLNYIVGAIVIILLGVLAARPIEKTIDFILDFGPLGCAIAACAVGASCGIIYLLSG